MKGKNKKVLVAMSGGVDSTAAAFLLQKEGYEVIGSFMRLSGEYQGSESAARKVCTKLGIKFFPINISDKFNDVIVDYFIDAYESGSTPNPCVRCNKLIKFGELLKWKDKLGADFLATGHYIKNSYNQENDEYEVFRADDKSKDQSYFLYNLGQAELKQILFPLSDWQKDNVKELVKKENLPTLQKESMDICFLQKNGQVVNQNEYLEEKIDLKPGPIVWIKEGDQRENIEIGQHKGLPLYTLGQRRGVELGGTGPYYVSGMDFGKNILYVVKNSNDPLLMSEFAISVDNNFISNKNIKFKNPEAVIRYGHKGAPCVIEKQDNNTIKTIFQKPQRAVTPGQSVVWYLGDKLIGGGVIKNL